MLFTENELYSINPLSILDECMYLGYDESLVNPITIPIKENTRLGYNIVRFDDVYTLSESYGIDYIDAMYSIAENNNIDPNDLAVSVPEEDIIAYPELVNELANIVIEPISTNDIEYRLCEECINSWIDTGNEEYIEYLLEDSIDILDNLGLLNEDVDWGEGPLMGPISGIKDRFWGLKHHMTTKNIGGRIKNVIVRNPLKAGNVISGVVPGAGLPLQLWGTANGVNKIYQNWKHRPKSFIAKKIAALRKLYATWLHRAKIERDDKTASFLKRVCTNIMLLIDKLLFLLQRAGDKVMG